MEKGCELGLGFISRIKFLKKALSRVLATILPGCLGRILMRRWRGHNGSSHSGDSDQHKRRGAGYVEWSFEPLSHKTCF